MAGGVLMHYVMQVKRKDVNEQLNNITLFAEGSNPSTCSVVNDVCKIDGGEAENIRNCDIVIDINCKACK